jgi:tripartite-type tricarboxylate transporter receptor subunit TctC
MKSPRENVMTYEGPVIARRDHPATARQWPDVPTFREPGFPPRKDGELWIGVFAPPRMPPGVVATLSNVLTEAMAQPEYRNKVLEHGMTPQSGSGTEYARFFADDYERWGKLVRDERLEQE